MTESKVHETFDARPAPEVDYGFDEFFLALWAAVLHASGCACCQPAQTEKPAAARETGR